MKALMETILEGWPDDVKQVPTALREYWLHWATLCVEDGLILKGENLVIPPNQRPKHKLRTMIPCKICDNNLNTEGIHDCLDKKSENQKTGVKGHELAPLYTGQNVS